MIDGITQGFARWLVKANAITEEDQKLYAYGMYSFLFTLAPLALVLLIGLVLGIPVEGIFFILPFILIRKFSGGFHLESPAVCLCSSISVLTLFLLGIRWMLDTGSFLPVLVGVGAAAFSLLVLSPIDSEERRLSEKERRLFQKIAIAFTVIIAGAFYLLMALKIFSFAVPIGCGLVLSALLQLPCLVERFRKKPEKFSKITRE